VIRGTVCLCLLYEQLPCYVLEAENARLKKLLAEAMLEQEATREVLRKSW
jgi:hypothetical protein